MKNFSSVAESRRPPKEAEKYSLEMRAREPRRRQIPGMENPALGNDAVVGMGGGVEG